MSAAIGTKIQQKKPQRLLKNVEGNYKISRRVYQALFIDFADIFIKYIHSLDPNEIQELDNDLKVNEWGVEISAWGWKCLWAIDYFSNVLLS